jgi:phage terminase large subunit-like protein
MNTLYDIKEYCKRIINNPNTFCEKTILNAERFLNDLEDDDIQSRYTFDIEYGNRPIRFIESFCVPSKGIVGKFKLLDWQKFVIYQLYGWIDRETKVRRFREGLIIIPRKQGKSTLLSALALYHLTKDNERGAECYVLANSKQQAGIILDETSKMVKSSPLLHKHIETFRDVLKFGNSKLEKRSADSEKLDGLNTSFAVFDEIHQFKNFNLINVIKNSTGARSNPLVLYITTKGYVKDGALDQLYNYAKNILNGDIINDRFFTYIAELEPYEEHSNPDIWIKANPSLGQTTQLEDMLQEYSTVKEIPDQLIDFLLKRLNMTVNTTNLGFVSSNIVTTCASKKIDEDVLIDKDCYGGYDLSLTTDLSSVALIFPLENGRFHVISHSFTTEERVKLNQERLPYESYIRQNLITVCTGGHIDYNLVLKWFIDQSEKYSINEIGYDPYNSTLLNNELSILFKTKVVRQGAHTLSPILKELQTLFIDQKIQFNGDPLLKYAINNVEIIKDSKNNITPKKASRFRKIDPFMAMVNGFTVCLPNVANDSKSGSVGFISL